MVLCSVLATGTDLILGTEEELLSARHGAEIKELSVWVQVQA